MNTREKAEENLKRLDISLRDASIMMDETKNAFCHIDERPDSDATKKFLEKLEEREINPEIWIEDLYRKAVEIISSCDVNVKEEDLKKDVKFLKNLFYVDDMELLKIYMERDGMIVHWDLENKSFSLQSLVDLGECVGNALDNLNNVGEAFSDELLEKTKAFKNDIKNLEIMSEKLLYTIMTQFITEEKVYIFLLEKLLDNKGDIPLKLFTNKELRKVSKEVRDYNTNWLSSENRKKLEDLLEERKATLERMLKSQKEILEEKERERNEQAV